MSKKHPKHLVSEKPKFSFQIAFRLKLLKILRGDPSKDHPVEGKERMLKNI